MPPKQKQVKKGPTYKPATHFKDIVPSSIKQQPREPRLLKIPQIQVSNTDKNIGAGNESQNLFQQWPTQEVIKAHDFGIVSDVKFQDKSHTSISQYIGHEMQSKQKMVTWKYIHQLHNMQAEQSQEQSYSDQEDDEAIRSSANFESKKQKQEAREQQNTKPIVVIETYLRQQTEEQMQKRKKQQAEKAQKAAKDKKKGKKQQPKQQGPLQVSDVKMSDVIVKKYMSPSGIWIGSQLQIIKIRDLRDVYTNEPVWKKIYPQQNGVPQITKSGKYWVKLYYMGKPVKVQIDDRVPVDHNTKELFAISQKNNEKWTLILTKALIKLLSLSNPKSTTVGSGMIINALTGMITENINVKDFGDWPRLQDFLNNKHYNEKDIIISCFNLDADRQAPSNFITNKQEMRNIITLENSTFKKKGRRRSSAVLTAGKGIEGGDDLEQQKVQQKYVDTNLIPGYSYCIGDYFQNETFNMVFSKPKSLKQQKLRLQYNEMSKVVLSNKTREQKLQHRRKKKQIKEKLQIQEKKRLELINKPIINYHFVKLLADIIINCEYSHKEILLAKKCVLNELDYPPNYEIPNQQKDKDKDKEKQKEEANLGATTAVKFKEDSEVNPSLDDFSSLENHQQLQPRPEEGIWIKDEDLVAVFDQFQFYYNPNTFQFKSIETVTSKNPKQFTTDQNKEILVVEKRGNPHLEQSQIQQGMAQKINVLFGFAFEQSKWDTMCDPYCMLQKFDFQSYRTASNVTTLNKPLSSTYLSLNNNNSVFRIYTISRGRYAYWISSESKYKLLSLADYLTEFQNYAPKNFAIQYPPVEKGTFLTFARIKIRHEGDQSNILFFKLKNCPKEIQKYLSIKIVQVPSDNAYTSQQQEGIINLKLENLHLVYEYTRAQLQPNKTYYFILQAYPAQSVAEGTIEMTVLSKISSGLTLDQAEQIQPYKVTQKYNPNKYANILKERLFCNSNINATLVVKIFEGQEGQPIVTDKKAAKKGGKQEPTFEIIQRQLQQKRLIHVKLFKNGNLIYYNKDYNEVIISNIELEKTKEDVIYYLEASFDLREWPEAAIANEWTNKVYWSIQVTGEDAIAFVKDTLQEQKQRETRKSWEDKQPGRAEKAKKARQKFLLQLKQQAGQALTEEQLQIVNAPKLTKKKLLEEEKKNEQNKKGGKGAKKDDKKAAGKDKKQQVIEEKQQQRPPPKSQDNFMSELKQFLTNLQNFKVTKVQLDQNEEPKIRSQQEQNSIKEAAIMAKQNRTAQIMRNIEMRQTMKIRQKDKKDKLTILLQDSRTGFNTQWKQYLKFRIEDQEKDKTKQEKEKALIDIVKQEKPTINDNDLAKLINEYKSIEGFNEKLADVGDMVRKNIKIANMTDKINNAVQGWEVEILKVVEQEIKNQKIEGINEETLTKMRTMLEEAAKNPAIVTEKQAQLKKTKKGGKK